MFVQPLELITHFTLLIRRARAWRIREKKREKAGRTMFRALRRAFNSYLSHSFQRLKHGCDLVAAVETINEMAEKVRRARGSCGVSIGLLSNEITPNVPQNSNSSVHSS